MKKSYYNSPSDFDKFHKILKQTNCPHCNMIGALVLNGAVKGYNEKGDDSETIKGRRVFCNNRKKTIMVVAEHLVF